MLESDIRRELPADWDLDEAGVAAVLPDESGSNTTAGLDPTETVVATHTDGASLVLEHVGASGAIDADWYVGIERPLESNGWAVHPTTHEAFFEDSGSLCAYINERTAAVSDGTESYTAFAVVPHDGSTPSILTPDGGAPRPEHLDGKPGFADVFTVRDSALEDNAASLSTLRDIRADLIDTVLGDATTVPDELTTVDAPQQAHSEATLEVFTVSDPIASTSESSGDDTASSEDNTNTPTESTQR